MYWKTFFNTIFFMLHFSLCMSAQFFLNGSAIEMNEENCYQLTPEVDATAGSIWYANKIDLNESFTVVTEIFLGCTDGLGADGIAFGFQPVGTSIGSLGGDLGFGGISPSFGVEFDTWENPGNNDPAYDHISIFKNGSIVHETSNNLAGPVSATSDAANIEDCMYHDLRLTWDAENFTMKVYFDCELRLSYTGDIVAQIFDNNPLVYWGFTAATGGVNNFHRVCLKYSSFQGRLEDVVICPGGQVSFQINDGVTYSWLPTIGLDNPFSSHPTASPNETTLYTVEIKDICGNSFYDNVLVEVAGNPVFFDLGQDTLLCENEILELDVSTPTATYLWSNGNQTSNITVTDANLYSVTVTRTDTFCISTDKIAVSYTNSPTINLGTDTSLCQNQTLLLYAYHDNTTQHQWQDGSQQDSFIVKHAGNYSILLTNICGTFIDEIQIDIENCREVYAPNAFSPNFDGINDNFMLLDGGDVRNIKYFAIFDRWGNLIFERDNILPNDSSNAWDGQSFPIGVYAWLAEIEFRDGRSTIMKGEVTLIR